jgi:hypothetical protein
MKKVKTVKIGKYGYRIVQQGAQYKVTDNVTWMVYYTENTLKEAEKKMEYITHPQRQKMFMWDDDPIF